MTTAAGLVYNPKNPLVLVGVRLSVTDVLDLADAAVQRALATSTSELTGAWRWVPAGGLPPTQLLGKASFASGLVKGLRYRSSKRPDACCLAVFPDRLVRGQDTIEVVDGTGELRARLP